MLVELKICFFVQKKKKLNKKDLCKLTGKPSVQVGSRFQK